MAYRRLGIVLILLVTSSVNAATYRVGPARSYTTLAALFNAINVQAGDLIEVDGDATYSNVMIPASASGTAVNPVTIRGIRINGKRPHISGGTNTVHFERSDHVVLEGFEITGGSSRCVFVHAHDITLRDLAVHACPAHGILSADQDSGSLTLEYSEIYDAGSGTTRHPLYIQSDEVAHPGSVFRMQHCYVHDGNGGNLLKSRHERNEIYYNWFEGATYHELELIGPDQYEQSPGWSADLVREDSDVVGNVIVHSKVFGAVIRVGGDGTGESRGRTRFVNNTMLITSGVNTTIFRIFDGIQALEAHNNVFYASAGGTLNIERTVEAGWVNGRRVGGSSNWIPAGSLNIPPEWTATLSASDPGLTSIAAHDLTPRPDSALRDAGNTSPQPIPGYALNDTLFPPLFQPRREEVAPGTARVRPTASRIDIGAFEQAAEILFQDGFES